MLKRRLENQLKLIRGIGEQLLSVFKTPEQSTHRVRDQANHSLWFVGHLGTSDDAMIGLLAPERTSIPEGYRERFGTGSGPSCHPAGYPAAEEMLGSMRDRRERLWGVLAGLDQADLEKPGPKGIPEDMVPDVASLFEPTVWNEALHPWPGHGGPPPVGPSAD